MAPHKPCDKPQARKENGIKGSRVFGLRAGLGFGASRLGFEGLGFGFRVLGFTRL